MKAAGRTALAVLLGSMFALPSTACEIGVAASKLSTKVFDDDSVAKTPLPIVYTGTNAPEALVHIYRVTRERDGRRIVLAYAGPCSSQLFIRRRLIVAAGAQILPGDLFYTVPLPMKNPTDLSEAADWGLRRASLADERRYQTCHWQ